MKIDTLFLSGCGTKGNAFTGTLFALVQKKIIDLKKIERYVCCSGSSIVAIMLCCGYSLQMISKLSDKLDYLKMLNLDDLDNIFLNNGIFTNDNIGKFINNIINLKYKKKI